MIFEKIELKFNIQKLRDWFDTNVNQSSITMRSRAVGGWSVLSSNQKIEDGWQTGYVPYNGPSNQNPAWIPSEDTPQVPMQAFCEPTPLCTGYMASIIEELSRLQFNPRRARIILLKKESEGQWHQDGSSRFYQVRLHIPIYSNSECFFETKEGRDRMVDDGSCYLVHINQPHRVVNKGPSDRYHFVVNVWDQNGLSLHHKFLK